jgi:hypothetical protein
MYKISSLHPNTEHIYKIVPHNLDFQREVRACVFWNNKQKHVHKK